MTLILSTNNLVLAYIIQGRKCLQKEFVLDEVLFLAMILLIMSIVIAYTLAQVSNQSLKYHSTYWAWDLREIHWCTIKDYKE